MMKKKKAFKERKQLKNPADSSDTGLNMDSVLQIEIILNMINTLFSKSVSFKDTESIDKLNILRHQIYYKNFDYDITMSALKKISNNLKKHE